jgi:hypothetical protein
VSYADLLRDPRWQRKRLEVMEAARFTCVECGDTSTTLNVHHTYYRKGAKPWEYEAHELLCLCEPCHERITELLLSIQRALGPLSVPDMESALAAILAIGEKSKAYAPSAVAAVDPIDARLAEIDRLLPAASSTEKDELTREKMRLRDEQRASGKRPGWKAFR